MTEGETLLEHAAISSPLSDVVQEGPSAFWYDRIGVGYADQRQPDARLSVAITRALGDARTVLNVGAGAGSYEPRDRSVVAVEPAALMIKQRSRSAATCVQARAEYLPFADGTFDASMAILTIHHWEDRERGLTELGRVAQRVVIVTHALECAEPFWLLEEYFPEIAEIDRLRFPRLAEPVEALPDARVSTFSVPHDCRDGFLGAYWRRPAAYLDWRVRLSMSTFSALPETVVKDGVDRLRRDLETGAWRARHTHLLERDDLDVGYRIIVAGD